MRSCPGRSQSRRTSATVAGQGHHTVGECAFLLKSCSSLRRCTARPPDRSDWSVCRVCSPARPPALRMVHISNFTSQFQHTRTHRARFSRRVPSDHRMAGQCRGPVKVSVCMKRYTYRAGPMHRGPAAHTCLGGTARNPTLLSPHPCRRGPDLGGRGSHVFTCRVVEHLGTSSVQYGRRPTQYSRRTRAAHF